MTASRTNPNPIPVTSWRIAVDYSDLRYEGGIHVGGYGKPILPWQWLSGEKIVETIKEKNASAAERDEAREKLASSAWVSSNSRRDQRTPRRPGSRSTS